MGTAQRSSSRAAISNSGRGGTGMYGGDRGSDAQQLQSNSHGGSRGSNGNTGVSNAVPKDPLHMAKPDPSVNLELFYQPEAPFMD